MKQITQIIIMLLVMTIFGCSSEVIQFADNPSYIPPSVKFQPRMMYPKLAQENSYTGTSKIILHITKDGKVEKAEILESTGSEILDNASLKYCNQLQFNPAMRNNNPVPSKISWAINYSIMDFVWDPYFYVRRIVKLYEDAENAGPSEIKVIQREILAEHENYINNMRDVINFNSFMESALSDKVVNEWKRDWNAWPVSFLLFHDFLQRFSDYDSLQVVMQKLKNAVLYDLDYITNTPTQNVYDESEKKEFLNKIKSFLSKHYPDIYKQTFSNFWDQASNEQYL